MMCDCENCAVIDREAEETVTALSKILIERGATNEVVMITSIKLLMSAVAALKMPPQAFLSMVCSFYSEATDFDIVPVQVAAPSHPQSDDASKEKPN